MVEATGATPITRPLYFQRMLTLLDAPIIKVLTGVRRCGKSTLLSLLATHIRSTRPDAVVTHLNLESTAGLRIRSTTDLLAALTQAAPDRSRRTYLLIDEVQLVPEWERVINALRADWDCDIYLTGSNSQMLSGELATHLAGRYSEIRVQPFTFEEFVRSRTEDDPAVRLPLSSPGHPGENQLTSPGRSRHTDDGVRRRPSSPQPDPAQASRLFSEYLEVGGFPMLRYLPQDREEALRYVRGVYDSALVRDVIEHHQIRDVDLFNRLVQYCLANVGRTFSAASISRFLKSEGRRASVDTILAYLHYCCEAFLLDRVGREEITSKQRLMVEEKYYAVDHSLRSALGLSNTSDIELVLENIVYRELVARGYEAHVGRVGGAGSQEIDFVARRGGQTLYVQVTYLLASEATVAREFGALAAIRDNLPKLVLSMDQVDFTRDGIVHRSLVDWLLDVPAH